VTELEEVLAEEWLIKKGGCCRLRMGPHRRCGEGDRMIVTAPCPQYKSGCSCHVCGKYDRAMLANVPRGAVELDDIESAEYVPPPPRVDASGCSCPKTWRIDRATGRPTERIIARHNQFCPKHGRVVKAAKEIG
jgi:hypothetical protein